MNSPSFQDLFAQQLDRQPEAVAVVDAPNRTEFISGSPRRVTWSQLDQEIDRVAERLVNAGAGAGTAVGYQLANSVELVATLLACFRIGAVAVPFPIQHRSHEIGEGISVAGISVMVTAPRPDRADQFAIIDTAIAASGRTVSVIDITDDAGDISDASGDAAAQSAARASHGSASPAVDRPVTICWTSGTTGTPKGVPRNTAMWLASGSVQVEQIGLTDTDRILCPFPLVNMAGIGGMLVPWLIAGAELHLHQPLNLPVFLGQIASEQITYTVAPPAILNMLLLDDSLVDPKGFASLHRIASGAAPLDPWMVKGWADKGVEIINIFGSNEGAALISTAREVPDPELRARCFPQPPANRVQTKLIDVPTGDEIVEPGLPGELRFRGPTVFHGYVGSDGVEFDEDGYFCTGDVFEWVDVESEPRLLRFVDRVKDIVIRGGMNVSAAEVEALVMASGLFTECAVIGYPDAALGQRVGLVGVPVPPPDSTDGDTASDNGQEILASVVAHLRDLGVASYKLPEKLELVESLPRNATGKVLKVELRQAWEAAAQ